MLRDGGNAGFAFALDEIKIFDGPCGIEYLIIFLFEMYFIFIESPTTISSDTV